MKHRKEIQTSNYKLKQLSLFFFFMHNNLILQNTTEVTWCALNRIKSYDH